MKFKLELPIKKSRTEVWKAFDNISVVSPKNSVAA